MHLLCWQFSLPVEANSVIIKYIQMTYSHEITCSCKKFRAGLANICTSRRINMDSLLIGVSSDYAQPITCQVTEVSCPMIGRAQPELTSSKRQKTGPGLAKHMLYASICSGSKNTVNNMVRIGQVFISPIVSTAATGEKVPLLKTGQLQTIFLSVRGHWSFISADKKAHANAFQQPSQAPDIVYDYRHRGLISYNFMFQQRREKIDTFYQSFTSRITIQSTEHNNMKESHWPTKYCAVFTTHFDRHFWYLALTRGFNADELFKWYTFKNAW